MGVRKRNPVTGLGHMDELDELDERVETECLDNLQAAAQLLARQALSEYGHSADPGIAQYELLSQVLGEVREIRSTVEEVARIVQKQVADTAHEGVMDDVNATLPNDAKAPGRVSFRPCGGYRTGGPGGFSSEVITIQEIADHLRVDRKTVTRWCNDGDMPPAIAVRGVKRWRRAVIEAWLLEREQAQ